MKKSKFLDIDFAKLDLERLERKGVPEIIYAPHKEKEHIKEIVINFLNNKGYAIISRAEESLYEYLSKSIPLRYKKKYYAKGRIILFGDVFPVRKVIGDGVIITAGTSDFQVASECKAIMDIMRCNVDMICDIGISSIGRLLAYRDKLVKYDVAIVVAGMDGALPTVIAGMLSVPVIGVPTSIGYGTNLNGISSLLTMLNSCSPGIAIVNIDGGIQAGIFAYLILSSKT